MAERVRVGVRLDRPTEDLGGWLAGAAAYDAAGADALWLEEVAATEFDPVALAAALAAVTYRSLLVTSTGGTDNALATIDRLSRGRLGLIADLDGWEHAEYPESREAWRAALADAAERGVYGLVVPADPRLLDLLRNPDDQGDRRDLHLAQG